MSNAERTGKVWAHQVEGSYRRAASDLNQAQTFVSGDATAHVLQPRRVPA